MHKNTLFSDEIKNQCIIYYTFIIPLPAQNTRWYDLNDYLFYSYTCVFKSEKLQFNIIF